MKWLAICWSTRTSRDRASSQSATNAKCSSDGWHPRQIFEFEIRIRLTLPYSIDRIENHPSAGCSIVTQRAFLWAISDLCFLKNTSCRACGSDRRPRLQYPTSHFPITNAKPSDSRQSTFPTKDLTQLVPQADLHRHYQSTRATKCRGPWNSTQTLRSVQSLWRRSGGWFLG